MNGGFDWMNMFGNMRDVNPDKMIDELLHQAEVNMLNQVKARLEQEINKRSNRSGPKYDKSMDPFEILNIDMNCTEEDFKAAYRKKVFETHPDRGGDPEQFKKVQAAYEAIKRFKGWN